MPRVSAQADHAQKQAKQREPGKHREYRITAFYQRKRWDVEGWQRAKVETADVSRNHGGEGDHEEGRRGCEGQHQLNRKGDAANGCVEGRRDATACPRGYKDRTLADRHRDQLAERRAMARKTTAPKPAIVPTARAHRTIAHHPIGSGSEGCGCFSFAGCCPGDLLLVTDASFR